MQGRKCGHTVSEETIFQKSTYLAVTVTKGRYIQQWENWAPVCPIEHVSDAREWVTSEEYWRRFDL